jgi:hypothetical protein
MMSKTSSPGHATSVVPTISESTTAEGFAADLKILREYAARVKVLCPQLWLINPQPSLHHNLRTKPVL